MSMLLLALIYGSVSVESNEKHCAGKVIKVRRKHENYSESLLISDVAG